MAKLVVTQTRNYTGETLLDIQAILFDTTAAATATFASNQFGPGEIENNVAITGDGFANTIRVNLSSAGTFSAAGWSFSNWSANDRVILAGTTGADTITGTAFNDVFSGGAGADQLSGGAGNDIFVFNAGDVATGEIIDGGTQTTSDQIQLATSGTYNFTAATVTGIEFLNLTTTGITASFTGSQLGVGGINVVSGTVDVFTQAIIVNGSVVNLSNVTFAGWGGVNQTLSINGTNATANTLTGSSQRDTISGTGNSSDLITGGGGNDTLNGGGGADTFRYFASSDTALGETVNGGGGLDTLQLHHSGAIDFRPATLSSIERVQFAGTQFITEAIFNASQFGGTGIANNLLVAGDDGSDQITVRMVATGGFSAGAWTFSSWDSTEDAVQIFGTGGADTIIGSSQRDIIEGGDGADNLSGGAGDDVFMIRASDLPAGESINGGSHVAGDGIMLTANANLSLATVSGIERLDMISSSATLAGGQIGTSTIREVSGNPTATQSLTVNGDEVDLSGVSFLNWGGANQTITINGISSASNFLTGSAQRDTINGVGNVNHITGGGGADTLNGGNNIDYFYFAAGSDVVAGEVINGGAGSNELIIQNAGTYNFSLATLSNIDSVGIGSGVIAIFDGAQIGTGVVDTVYSSSAGVDTLIVNGPNIDLTGVLFAFWDAGDIINLNGTAAADTIVGSDEDDTIFGSGGADTLVGDQGNDIFRYVDFSDVVAGESIAGDDGTDVLRVEDFCDFSFATITGVEGLTFAPATATGNATAVFSGSQIGTSGITAIAGGGNRNRIVVTGPSVDLTELTFTNWTSGPPSTPGVDDITINGTSGADTLTGSSERDTFSISSGADALDGGGGDDQFLFFASPDAGTTVTGDDGLDTIVLQGFPSTFDITQASLESIERLHINTTAETILTGLQIGSVGITTVIGSGITGPGGSSVPDRLVVRGDFIDLTPVVFQVWQADDQITLLGTVGADVLFGSSQNDRIDGGTGGADTMGGAAGDDTYIVDNINDMVLEAFVQGTNDRVQTSTTYVLAAGAEIEFLETNEANGTVPMDLVGNELANTIIGNAATNTLVGGRGFDTLIGGGGADIYVWTAMDEMGAVVGAATDTVGPEFDANIGDRIAVNAIDVDGDGNTAEQEFTFLGEAATNPFTAPGQISWFNNVPGNETFILLNTDADAEHDGVIRVLGVHTVDANWFQL